MAITADRETPVVMAVAIMEASKAVVGMEAMIMDVNKVEEEVMAETVMGDSKAVVATEEMIMDASKVEEATVETAMEVNKVVVTLHRVDVLAVAISRKAETMVPVEDTEEMMMMISAVQPIMLNSMQEVLRIHPCSRTSLVC